MRRFHEKFLLKYSIEVYDLSRQLLRRPTSVGLEVISSDVIGLP